MAYAGRVFCGQPNDWGLVNWLAKNGFAVDLNWVEEGRYRITAPGWEPGLDPPPETDPYHLLLKSKGPGFESTVTVFD